MSNGVQFPANSVLDSYVEVELMLNDFLKEVPYCKEHEKIWSPKLFIVLQETCSQLDSLWRWETVNIHRRKGKINIRDYFELYGSQMAPRWVVFWADEPKRIDPFSGWQRANKFAKKESNKYPVDWWKEGCQKIKHERLEKRNKGTLKWTVNALAGLFLAIVRCEKCWDALWEKGLMSWYDSTNAPFDPLECLKADCGLLKDEGRCDVMHMAIESKLFTYPVGLCMGLVTANRRYPYWKGNCSNLFKAWYYKYCQNISEETTSAH